MSKLNESNMGKQLPLSSGCVISTVAGAFDPG